jgi:hypothetical protein
LTGFGGADPALLTLGRRDVNLVARGDQRARQFVQENAVEPIVVGDQKPHGRIAARTCGASKGKGRKKAAA